MDFSLSDQQDLLKQSVRRYCRENYDLRQRQQILRSAAGYDPGHWAAFAEFGWLGAALPEEAGGYGTSPIEAAIILEEFGRVLVLEPFLPCAVLAARALWEASGSSCQAMLHQMTQGKLLLALAHLEPGGHALAYPAKTLARRLPSGGFEITGAKAMVLGGNRAEKFIVSARTAGCATQPQGVSLFLMDCNTPGLVRRNYRTLDGSGTADLLFREVRVGAQDLLGTEGQGWLALEQALDFALIALCAEAVGSMDQVIASTVDYLKSRRAYNTTLSTYQALQHMLAEMLVELEMSRSIVHRALAASCAADRAETRLAASAAKALVGRAGKFIAARGIQLHGGMGMVNDYIIGQQFKRLTVIEALLGNSDYHLSRRYRLSAGVS